MCFGINNCTSIKHNIVNMLDGNNKLTKLDNFQLFSMNGKFGHFLENMSIDEKRVQYFERNSCKNVHVELTSQIWLQIMVRMFLQMTFIQVYSVSMQMRQIIAKCYVRYKSVTVCVTVEFLKY